MATDNDIKKDMEEAYGAGERHWSPYWIEARRDVKFKAGDQYSNRDKLYLKRMDREALVWNRTHRVVNLVAGYEQKNLLSLKIEPFEGADEQTASQFSGLVMNNMLYGGGYAAFSNAFEMGPVISGMNLVEHWIDRSDDLLNGDVRFRRIPYNRFILDPTFQDKDLDRDCTYALTRDYFSARACTSLLPEREKDIRMLKPRRYSGDNKFGQFYPLQSLGGETHLKYDRFYVEAQRPVELLVDVKTGTSMRIPEKADRRVRDLIRILLNRKPNLKKLKRYKKGVDLHIFVEGELMYSGLDPSGLDEYPFTLEAGVLDPGGRRSPLSHPGVGSVLPGPGD
jgi:hypothetical protein